MVVLNRFAYSPMGTFGQIVIDQTKLFTVERPRGSNRPSLDCIPEGLYPLRLGTYNKGGYPAYELLEVPGRSLIKIHIGNTSRDVKGCISPGLALGFVGGQWAVTSSATAYNAFMEAMGGVSESTILIRSELCLSL